MVIEYATTGPWVKNILPPDSPDEYLIAFYYPDTGKMLRQDLQVPEFAGIKLGEYLRECEASDHMGWSDPVKMQIVQRIQKNTVNQIRSQLKKTEEVKVDATASKLSNRLGKNLLPRVGYGKNQSGKGSSGGTGGGTKISNMILEIKSESIHNNELTMEYVLKLMHGKKDAKVSIMIASEGGWIDPEAWRDDIGTDFPVVFEECYVNDIATAVTEQVEVKKGCSVEEPELSIDEIDVELKSVDHITQYVTAEFKVHVLNPTIFGRFKIKAYDKRYRFSFKIE